LNALQVDKRIGAITDKSVDTGRHVAFPDRYSCFINEKSWKYSSKKGKASRALKNF